MTHFLLPTRSSLLLRGCRSSFIIIITFKNTQNTPFGQGCCRFTKGGVFTHLQNKPPEDLSAHPVFFPTHRKSWGGRSFLTPGELTALGQGSAPPARKCLNSLRESALSSSLEKGKHSPGFWSSLCSSFTELFLFLPGP